MEPPGNRKQRRAAAAATTSPDSFDSFDPTSIPLAHSSRETASKNTKNARTLVDVISERKGNLLSGEEEAGERRFVTVDPPSGEVAGFDPSTNEEKKEYEEELSGEEKNQPLPAFLDTILLSFPLTTLHMTLAYLAAHQYAAEIPLSNLFRESAFVAFPILTLLIHLAHGHIIDLGHGGTDTNDRISLFPLTPEKLSIAFLRRLLFPLSSKKTFAFLLLSVLLGVKLMAITNEAPYYAVMKRAPAIGTLWVWCILEVPLGASFIGALGPLGWGVWWKGYGIF